VPLEEGSQVAALYPGSVFVPVAEAGHTTVGWTRCGRRLASRFIETLRAGNTRCASKPETVWPAVGRFPVLARDAQAASVTPGGDNQVDLAERRAVTVAVATATDAAFRGSWFRTADDRCLRGGTFHTDFGDDRVSTLTNCSFARDVQVDGTVMWAPDFSFVADLTIGGSGTVGGTLHVTGTWQAPGPVGDFTVSGRLGGSNVALLVPEA
jgi:hypothetical protein